MWRRSKGRCEDCGEAFHLELHHLRYRDDWGESIRGKETEGDLVSLCRECHHQRHRDINGEFWKDPEEMGSYWEPYLDAMEKDD